MILFSSSFFRSRAFGSWNGCCMPATIGKFIQRSIVVTTEPTFLRTLDKRRSAQGDCQGLVTPLHFFLWFGGLPQPRLAVLDVLLCRHAPDRLGDHVERKVFHLLEPNA